MVVGGCQVGPGPTSKATAINRVNISYRQRQSQSAAGVCTRAPAEEGALARVLRSCHSHSPYTHRESMRTLQRHGCVTVVLHCVEALPVESLPPLSMISACLLLIILFLFPSFGPRPSPHPPPPPILTPSLPPPGMSEADFADLPVPLVKARTKPLRQPAAAAT